MWCSRTFVNSANCRKHKLKDHPLEVAEYEGELLSYSCKLKMPTTISFSCPWKKRSFTGYEVSAIKDFDILDNFQEMYFTLRASLYTLIFMRSDWSLWIEQFWIFQELNFFSHISHQSTTLSFCDLSFNFLLHRLAQPGNVSSVDSSGVMRLKL